MGAFGNGFTAFVFPAVYHMWVYRTSKARAACLKPPPKYAHTLLCPQRMQHLCVRCLFRTALFVLPCRVYNTGTSEVEQLIGSALNRWIGGWTGAYILNASIATYFLTFGVGFGIWAALKNLINNIAKYSVFAKCYQVSTAVHAATHAPCNRACTVTVQRHATYPCGLPPEEIEAVHVSMPNECTANM